MRPLVLWHLLSLDAPSVATLWTWFTAHSCGLSLRGTSLGAMFLAVWILYAADRLLDTGASAEELEARHKFHSRHRHWFYRALVAASLALAPLLLTLPAMAVRLYLELGALLLGWFFLIHGPAFRPEATRRLPKELAVGLFFGAATFIPTVSRDPELRLRLLPDALLFAAVCSLNCLFIYAWEHPSAGGRQLAHPSTRFALKFLPLLAGSLGVMACGIALLQRSSCSRLSLAVASSAVLLLVLDRVPNRQRTVVRAAADLALLTPVFWIAIP